MEEKFPTEEEITKASYKENGIDTSEEEDMYDAVRLKIWSDGAKWMLNQIKNTIYEPQIISPEVQVKYDHTETITFFYVKVKGFGVNYIHGKVNEWITYCREENQKNGKHRWVDWSTGGVTAKVEEAFQLESWYQNYKNKNKNGKK